MSIRDLYGLKVDCKTSELEDFAFLHSRFDSALRKLLNILAEKKNSSADSNFVKIPGQNPLYLTFCIAGNNMQFGIYNKNTKNVVDSCKFDDIKELGQSEINRLSNIIENYIKNNIKMPSLNALDIAWREELRSRKEKEKTKRELEMTSPIAGVLDSKIAACRAPPKENKETKQVDQNIWR